MVLIPALLCHKSTPPLGFLSLLRLPIDSFRHQHEHEERTGQDSTTHFTQPWAESTLASERESQQQKHHSCLLQYQEEEDFVLLPFLPLLPSPKKLGDRADDLLLSLCGADTYRGDHQVINHKNTQRYILLYYIYLLGPFSFLQVGMCQYTYDKL